MAYGRLRFLYDNFVTPGMITPASQATGIVSGAQKTVGTESAILVSVGGYTGEQDRLYTIQIDSTTAGVSVGQATFRWRTSTTASGAWEASSVTTSASFLSLNFSVQIAWQSGPGNDFAVGNTWIFNANAIYGPTKMLDGERNTLFRTGATFPYVIDLGSAQQVTAFALLDHNISTGGTLTLQANTSDSWGFPAYSQSVNVQNPAYLYLDETYRYWRILPVDGSLSYFEVGELFLGTFTELEKCNADWGATQTNGYVLYDNTSYSGLKRRKAFAQQRRLNLSFPLTSNNDVDTLTTMQDALIDLETGEIDPLFVHLFYDEDDKLFHMDWENINSFDVEYFRVGWNNLSMQFIEQVKTRI